LAVFRIAQTYIHSPL